MEESVTSVFEDCVKALGRQDDNGRVAVIFKRHSAFYSIDPSLAVELETLEKSRSGGSRVQITADAVSMDILKVVSVCE